MPAQPQTTTKATLTAQPGGQPLTVHFNPASLTYTVENTVAQGAGAPKTTQYVAQFSGKLSMDLQFDTTDTGSDVRIATNQVAAFMQPAGSASAPAAAPGNGGGSTPTAAPSKAPQVVSFQWGSYQFLGVLDSFKETIDFFSAEGVALRALVSITLSRQDNVFDDAANFSQASTGGSIVPSGSGDSALSVATRGGDPTAMRQLGTDNGLESLRFTGGAQLQVAATGVQLNAAAGFAVSASAGPQAALGISVSIQASAQPGAAPYGSASSAGVPATAGAFAGLQTGRATVSSTSRLDPTSIVPSTAGADVTVFPGASFALGGAAGNGSSAGLATPVGAKVRLSDLLTFDSDD